MQSVQASHKPAGYSPGIDGLRAVAVMAVLLFHAGIARLPGGFVGVDVFFVISGYLITRLLVQEREATGRIDFRKFYVRRARRILPALFATLAGSAVVAAVVLTPQQLDDFGVTLLNAMISTSNIFFWTHTGYFDPSAESNALLHTWSLGVEEQFYLLWPLCVMLFGATVARRRWLVAVVGIASFAAAVLVVRSHPTAVFFLTPFRAFELAIGASLAVWPMWRAYVRGITADAMLLVGLAMIIAAILVFDERTPFPGTAALLPCLGAALCIASVDAARMGWVLSNPVAVWLGKISYSLYLVHWPIVVFYMLVRGVSELYPLDTLMLVAASIVAAAVLYRTVETPFRHPRIDQTRARARSLGLPLAVPVVVAIAAASMWMSAGWAWRPWMDTTLTPAAIKLGMDQRFVTRQTQCAHKGWANCDDLVATQPNVLLVGDSHGADALNAVARVFPNHNFVMSTHGGCPPIRDIDAKAPKLPGIVQCRELNRRRFDPAYVRQFDYVVIGVKFGWFAPTDVIDYLEFLKASGQDKVIVFGGYLTMREDLPDLVSRYGRDDAKLREAIAADERDDPALVAKVRELGFLYVSKHDALCGAGPCPLFDQHGVPFTWDKHHLSVEFANRVGDERRAEITRYVEAN